MGTWQYVEIFLWIISIGILAIVGILFLRDEMKIKNKYYIWLSLFFFLFIIARILRLYVRFYIGEPPPGEPLTGDAFIVESIYTIVAHVGIFFIYYDLESKKKVKTYYFFSIVVWITCLLYIIDFVMRSLLFVILVFFLISLMAFPLIYLYLGVKSDGDIRKKCFLVAIGAILFILSIALDDPDGRPIFVGLGEIFLAIVPPVFAICGITLMRLGFIKRL
jgi:hypothetical protein